MVTATTAARVPRGTKILAQAFFAAADEIPDAQRGAVVKAALALIRDDMKTARGKAAIAKTKAKGKSATASSSKKMGRPVGLKNKAKAPMTAKANKGAAKPKQAKAKAAPKSAPTKRAAKVVPETVPQTEAEQV